MKKLIAMTLCLMLALGSLTALGETLTGEADGFGGKIVAEVTVEDGKIVDLKLTGDGETPDVGGAALEPLTEAILAAGTIDGVDAYSGASWTSAGVFAAIRNALGIEEEAAEAEAETVIASASGLKQGLAIVATPRLGPGKDEQEVPVYSLNAVVAYVITDAEDRLVDLDVDILEIITPTTTAPTTAASLSGESDVLHLIPTSVGIFLWG